MSESPQRLNIPDSRYAAELSEGPPGTRFPPDLEREYHRFYLTERLGHVRSFNPIMGALFAVAFVEGVTSSPAAGLLGSYLRVAIVVGAYMVITWAAYSRHYERIYLRTAFWASLIIGVAGAAEVAHRVHEGEGELLAVLTAYSIGLYFLTGILYRAALVANIATVVAFTAALILFGEAADRIMQLAGTLAAIALIGTIAFRHQSIAFRRSFLEHGLIAELVVRDALTGLKNRRALDEHLRRTWQQALRDRRLLVVMLIDVDHFKKYNDRYGHQAGDEALQRVATTLDGFAKRPLDVAARYGGEEFALVLFSVSPEHGGRLAEQARAAVERLGLPHEGTTAGVVTISVGVAIVPPTLGRSPEGALQLADEALYAAKEAGRNCVRVFEAEYQGLATGVFRQWARARSADR